MTYESTFCSELIREKVEFNIDDSANDNNHHKTLRNPVHSNRLLPLSDKRSKMKQGICLFIMFATLFLLSSVLFFRDKLLFLLLGYNFSSMDTLSPEAVEVYASIQKWRLFLVMLTLISGISCFFVLKKMQDVRDTWYFWAGKILGIITFVLMTAILIVMMLLPKRIF